MESAVVERINTVLKAKRVAKGNLLLNWEQAKRY